MPRKKWRKHSAAEKLRIVREAAACTQRGDIEALLRREGIYSSLLTVWRKQLALHGSEALAGRKPGRKPNQDAKDRRIAELEKRSARLEEKLALAGVSMDLRAVPHSVCIVVGTGCVRRHFVVEKVCDHIVEADARAALASQGLRAHARDTASA